MKYARFEDLPVWQAAIGLADQIYKLTGGREFRGPGDLADQLRRAALSISNNIAEGFEQGTTAQLLSALYVARGSAGEVRSMLRFCERGRWMENGVGNAPVAAQRESEVSNLKSEISMAGGAASPEPTISDLKSDISKRATATNRAATDRAGTPGVPISNSKSRIPGSRPVATDCESQISNLKSEISNRRTVTTRASEHSNPKSHTRPQHGAAGIPTPQISNLKSEISKAGRATSQQPPISHLKTQIATNAQSSGGAASPGSPISNLKSEISNLIALAESCSRQLRAWADNLQNSEITGQRYLTDKSKNVYDSKKRADAFWKQCEEVVQRRLQESRDRHIASPSGTMMDSER